MRKSAMKNTNSRAKEDQQTAEKKKKLTQKNAETNDKASNNVFMNANIDDKSSLSKELS